MKIKVKQIHFSIVSQKIHLLPYIFNTRLANIPSVLQITPSKSFPIPQSFHLLSLALHTILVSVLPSKPSLYSYAHQGELSIHFQFPYPSETAPMYASQPTFPLTSSASSSDWNEAIVQPLCRQKLIESWKFLSVQSTIYCSVGYSTKLSCSKTKM